MKKIVNKLNDIGSFELKNTIRILFWFGVLIITYTSIRYRHIMGYDIYKYTTELKSKPGSSEMINSTLKYIDYLNIGGFIMTLLAKIALIRIGAEFLYIILNGFKSLSNREY